MRINLSPLRVLLTKHGMRWAILLALSGCTGTVTTTGNRPGAESPPDSQKTSEDPAPQPTPDSPPFTLCESCADVTQPPALWAVDADAERHLVGVDAEVGPFHRAGSTTRIPLFQSDRALSVEIVSDFPRITALERDPFNPETSAGTIRFLPSSTAIAVNLSNRGSHGRGTQCSFKPLRIKYGDRTSLGETPFKGTLDDEIDLVTHCHGYGVLDVTDDAQQRVFREFTLYRMLHAAGLITRLPRLAHIQYRNREGTLIASAYGFFLEPKKDMAARHGWKPVPKSEAPRNFERRAEEADVHLMLAEKFAQNWDFHADKSHNVVLLTDSAQVQEMSPFDFDRSTLVNPREDYQRFVNDRTRVPIELTRALGRFGEPYERTVTRFAARMLRGRLTVAMTPGLSPLVDKEPFQKNLDRWSGALEYYFSEWNKMRLREGLPSALDSTLAIAPTKRKIANSGAPCVVEIKNVKITSESRQSCLKLSTLLEPQPTISPAELRTGPPAQRIFTAEEQVHCRFYPRPATQNSPKFRCFTMNALGQFLGRDGEPVEGATSFDPETENLLDYQGRLIKDASGDPIKGDEIKVKYFQGNEPYPRFREGFVETAVTRLLWALGIPADRMYMPKEVRCEGCDSDPFHQGRYRDGSTTFVNAAIERRLDGKQIELEWNQGWGFDEAWALARGDAERHAELESLAIIFKIFAYNNALAFQNRLICRKGGHDKRSGECRDPIAYVQDVGSTLGGPVAGSQAARGDLAVWKRSRVFSDPARCTLFGRAYGPITQVKEASRLIIAERLSRLTREHVRAAFEAARFDQMDSRVNQAIMKDERVDANRARDRVLDAWTDEFMKRRSEVLETRCPH